MEIEQVLVFILTGAVAGWLAGIILKGKGFGLIGNIIAGMIGAVLGGWLFDALDINVGGEWIGEIVTALVGAILLLLAMRLIRKK